ncbi:hypothetical protein [Kocuria rosea]|uniref:hypothetical protein n=1 Tax=Kocuria rosea TaxID=1275 RepID=UPI000F8379E9|nr:hypothetical protein [Kocuria rosea]
MQERFVFEAMIQEATMGLEAASADFVAAMHAGDTQVARDASARGEATLKTLVQLRQLQDSATPWIDKSFWQEKVGRLTKDGVTSDLQSRQAINKIVHADPSRRTLPGYEFHPRHIVHLKGEEHGKDWVAELDVMSLVEASKRIIWI